MTSYSLLFYYSSYSKYIALYFYQIYLKFEKHNKCALTNTVTIHASFLLCLLCLCFSSIYPENLSLFLHTTYTVSSTKRNTDGSSLSCCSIHTANSHTHSHKQLRCCKSYIIVYIFFKKNCKFKSGPNIRLKGLKEPKEPAHSQTTHQYTSEAIRKVSYFVWVSHILESVHCYIVNRARVLTLKWNDEGLGFVVDIIVIVCPVLLCYNTALHCFNSRSKFLLVWAQTAVEENIFLGFWFIARSVHHWSLAAH